MFSSGGGWVCLCWLDFLSVMLSVRYNVFFFQAEDGIRDLIVTGVQTCALPISARGAPQERLLPRHRRPAPGGGLPGGVPAPRLRRRLRPPAERPGLRPRERRSRARRSEERRVGKECRSRWSPYH